MTVATCAGCRERILRDTTGWRTEDPPGGPFGPFNRTCPENLTEDGVPHPEDGIREGPHVPEDA